MDTSVDFDLTALPGYRWMENGQSVFSGELRKLSRQAFDETVELAFRLGVDPRKADQMIRGTVTLPHGTGRSVRVAAFATGDKARERALHCRDAISKDRPKEDLAKKTDLWVCKGPVISSDNTEGRMPKSNDFKVVGKNMTYTTERDGKTWKLEGEFIAKRMR